MQQPQGVQEQDWEVFQANKNPHLDMQVGIPMPREFPIAAIFLAAVLLHQGPVHRNSQSHPENMGLKNVPCQMDIHPLANGESKRESFWDLLQAITCCWPAPRKGEQLAASHFMHNLY